MKTTKALFNWLLLPFLAVLFLVSCNSKDEVDPLLYKDNTIWVVNQGSFGNGVGSLDVYQPEDEKFVSGAYKLANGASMPGNIQSMRWLENKAYVASNGLDAIVVLNEKAEEVNRIVNAEWLVTPRYFAMDDNYLYVSVWGNYTNVSINDFSLKESAILVLDKVTLDYVKEIPVKSGPEQLTIAGNKLWVGHSIWYAQQLTIVDLTDLSITKELSLTEGSEWVAAASDNSVWAKDGNKVIRYNNSDYAVLNTLEMPNSVGYLYAEEDAVYIQVNDFGSEKSYIYESNIAAATGDYTFRYEAGNFQTFLLDELSGETHFYTTFAPYTEAGSLIVSSPPVNVDNYETGIYPVQIVKK